MPGKRLNRRQVIAGGAAAGAALALHRPGAWAQSSRTTTLDFGSLGPGDGWPGWTCGGVANLRRAEGRGLLEAGSDVFPADPRPVAFAVDRRFLDGEIEAIVRAGGAGTGLVLRRVAPRAYYAAIVDDEESALVLVRRSPDGVSELARTPFARPSGAFRLSFAATGVGPTVLLASVAAGGGAAVTVSARDGERALQRRGDPGVLVTARTLFPSAGPPVLPALGNLHLLPWGVQEGQAFMQTPVGEAVIAAIRERSTAELESITIRPDSRVVATRPSVVAATSGAPLVRGGAMVRVAADVPARVEIEFALNRNFRRSRRVRVGRTNAFDAALASLRGLPAGRRVWWRARLRRRGRLTVGPARSFRVLPAPGSGRRTTAVIGSCASQFGPAFDRIAERHPDVFVWQGDVGYPDTMGPLAQTIPGYAGIWRDLLANPLTDGLFGATLFAAQRDDHDYGIQDANAMNLVPWGLAPWEGLVEHRSYYRFRAGLAEFWVLDQRRFKSAPEADDTVDKTLLGAEQRAWLLRSLAASPAPFKVVCSPCTLAPLGANARDGSWATGFTAERDLLLAHVRDRVRGRTVFVTGDTHWTMAYDRDGLFEVRPCPLGIPTPNDITLTQPQAAENARSAPGVEYADDERNHFAFLEVGAADGRARLDIALVDEAGATRFSRRLEEPLPRRRRRRR